MKKTTKPKRVKRKIGSIEEELKRCIAAFKKYPRSRYVWCCHHERLIEINDGYRKRIGYILREKPEREHARRFYNYRPVKPGAFLESLKRCGPNQYTSEALEVHNEQWPDNTWIKLHPYGAGTIDKTY